MERDVIIADRFEQITYFEQTRFASGDRKGPMKENFITLRQSVSIWHDSGNIEFSASEFNIQTHGVKAYKEIKNESFAKVTDVKLDSLGFEGVAVALPGFMSSVFDAVKKHIQKK